MPTPSLKKAEGEPFRPTLQLRINSTQWQLSPQKQLAASAHSQSLKSTQQISNLPATQEIKLADSSGAGLPQRYFVQDDVLGDYDNPPDLLPMDSSDVEAART